MGDDENVHIGAISTTTHSRADRSFTRHRFKPPKQQQQQQQQEEERQKEDSSLIASDTLPRLSPNKATTLTRALVRGVTARP